MIRALALFASLAACATAPPPVIAAHAPPARAPTTPPPSVRWIDNGFELTQLPAITADGARIVVAEIAGDGGRGNPNLRIVARERTDAPVEKITVLRVDEVDTLFTPEGAHPQLDARLSAANTWLARLHHDAELVALPKLEVDATDGYTQHAASAGAVSLDWHADRLTIFDGGRPVHSRTTPSTWHAPREGSCENPAKLGAAWVDLPRRIALVEIIYNGTDTCWEPSGQLHVISW